MIRRLWLLTLLGALGCDGPTDPGEPGLLLPDLAGEWTGTFVGAVGVVGAPGVSVRDTFRLVFAFEQDGAEVGYYGEVLRGAAGSRYLYGCQSGGFTVTQERHVRLDCVQATQLDATLVLRVRGEADAAGTGVEGVVYDVVGAEGTEYDVTLRRSAP